MQKISDLLDEQVRITPFDLPINVAAGARIGARYSYAFPLLMAARHKPVGVKVEARVKPGDMDGVLELARLLQKTGALALEHTDMSGSRVVFRCLDTTLLDNEWAAGFCAFAINQSFRGLPYSYLLWPTLCAPDGRHRRRFEAVFAVGETLGAIVVYAHGQRDDDAERLLMDCEALGFSPENVVALLTPRADLQQARTRLMRQGVRAEPIGQAWQALRSLRVEEAKRHRAALKAIGV